MKKIVIAICSIGILYAAYWAWPLVGLHKISQAIAARDATELSARLDLPSLKRSITDQIARTPPGKPRRYWLSMQMLCAASSDHRIGIK
jgi:hypothetical protein